MVKQTLTMAAISLALSSGSAFAHEIPPITTGDAFTINEGTITWTGSNGQSLNNTTSDLNAWAYHFDVTTAGSLDVYTADDDTPASYGGLFIYKKDAVGTDWTLIAANYEGQRVDMLTPTNIFGVSITGYQSAINGGKSDAGVRMNFDTGSYLALVINNQGWPVGQDPITNAQDPDPVTNIYSVYNGSKLSNGFTWSYLGDPCVDAGLCEGLTGQTDFYVKASPGSLAVAGPTVEAPVPVPGAVWLMGSALAGFTAFGRKKTIAA